VDLKFSQDGQCRGFGFVTFSKLEDANKAIEEMNDKPTDGGKKLVVVLSDRQQGKTKADTKGKGDAKGTKGKKGDGKSKATPSNAVMYPYNYGYMYPSAYYGGQAQTPEQQQAMANMQAHLLYQAQAAAMQAQAYYGGLTGGVVPGAAAVSAAAVSQSAKSQEVPSKEFEGVLKSISAKNGYGFITCTETRTLYNRDVFVDAVLLPEGVAANDKVTFTIELSEKGHPRATEVKVTK